MICRLVCGAFGHSALVSAPSHVVVMRTVGGTLYGPWYSSDSESFIVVRVETLSLCAEL